MKILSLAGSLRSESANKKLAREAIRLLGAAWLANAEYADLRDYPMPIYDGDQERADGIPDAVQRLAAKIVGADALIVATPEYNGGISSVLKNTIDWLSHRPEAGVASGAFGTAACPSKRSACTCSPGAAR